MDLETENRLAVLLLEEARRLRQEADKQGVHAYLQKPNVRHRPNSRFLAATVRGVQQANRVVEVNEMWRAREKELELESRMKSRSSSPMDSGHKKRNNDSRGQTLVSRIEEGRSFATSSMKDSHSSSYSGRQDGLGDDEVEAFLHSRVKRGRGAIGCRMDEPGPYLTAPSGGQDSSACPDVQVEKEQRRRIQGPEKPPFLISKSSGVSPSTSKHRHREEKSRGRNSDRTEEKKSKHHHQHKSRSRV